MKRLIILGVLASFALGVPAVAQKVTVDYSKGTDFSKYKTYMYQDSDESIKDTDQLMHDRVVAGIKDRLNKLGMTESSNADCVVTYYAAEKVETRVHTSHMGYGYYDDWHWGGGMGSSTSQVINYAVGTLIIDLYDKDDAKLFWRGSISATVSSNPSKDEKKISKGLDKLIKKWERMAKKEGIQQ